ncbi:Structural maintenance of chromosomes protein 6 [Pleurotus pulmonarius]|nr:Structural maintenance of chromosomes protein 6 [Pleurotus pulmonarius]
MPKRRAQDSDDEVDGPSAAGTPVSKRPRPDAEAPKPSQGRRKNKGKAKQAEEIDDDTDESDDEERGDQDIKEEEEQQFEQGYEDIIRAHIEAKRKVQGGVAEHGIIESIEMHQFMCHKYLTFDFGPQINFIIGHNGSGKSAVLSAITVALGGKTTSTGRGSGLKSFIREGQSQSEVTITIKNQGEEAYKPQEYGKSIIITRRFSKEGSSTWKIKSKDGRTISTKKEELAAICDHMNIQVDNPMNVLTQDAARQFLSASHPNDKYKFFLKGTQLSQLSEEYELCFDNIKATSRVLNQKKEALPDLRAEFREATRRFEEAAKARELKKKQDELKKELAWAHVKTKELEMEKQMRDTAKLAKGVPKLQELVDEAEAKFQSATEEVARYESEFKDLGDIGHLNDRKKELQDQIRANKNKLTDFRNDEKQIDSSVKGINRQIEEYTQQIAIETRKLEVDTQAKREEAQQRLQAARDAVTAAETLLAEHQEQHRDAQQRVNEFRAQGIDVETKLAATHGRITEFQELISHCQKQVSDELSAFGKNMDAVRTQVKKMAWHGDLPLGPLGVGVKIREEHRWADDVLRAQLGSLLVAWAVTDARDMPALKKLLRDSGNGTVNVIIFEKDLFDYSQGEPAEGMLTVLRALEIPDPYVLRILINQAMIERVFLAPWTADGLRVNVFGGGGGQTTQLHTLRGGDPMNLLLRARDVAVDTQRYRQELSKHEEEHIHLTAEKNQLKAQYGAARRELDQIMAAERKADTEARQAKVIVDNLLQAQNDDLPANVASLEAAKREAEAEKETILAQYTELTKQKSKVDEAQKPLMVEFNRIRDEISDFDRKGDAIRNKIENAVTLRMKAQSDKNHYQAKLQAEQRKVDEAEAQVKVLTEEFINWTARAEEYCERVENPRKPDDIQKSINAVEQALKDRERKQGSSVEELTIQVNKAKAKLDLVERDLKSMALLNKTLRHSLFIRLSKWQEFRRHIALRCKLVFQYNLSHRGYFGKVLFDHANGTLQLKVQTDDMAGTQGAQDKDPRSLSGGEKSFSTICLLLSLWESIGCPLRCLDEFDVFMDAVNRRISMKMMIETANSSDKKQYILITPQDMTNVQLGPTVVVNRMPDPERGQVSQA